MRKVTILLSIVMFFFISFVVTAKQESKIKIIIDPGHGGKDGGATYNDIKESDINLKISKKTAESLKDYGYEVVLTRNTDEDCCKGEYHKIDDLKGRAEIINKSEADLFLSIHLNFFSLEKIKGYQIMYSNANVNSKLLGWSLNKYFSYYLGNSKRGMVLSEGLYLLDHVYIPGCLIECGFLSNEWERSLLITDSYQQKIATAISLGIDYYFMNKVEYL